MSHAARKCMDCAIMIYNDDRTELIAKTFVTGYGKEEMYIEVSEGLENVKPGTRLQLLVLHPGSVSEFEGKLRSVRQGIYEISLFGLRQRDARASTRYPMKTPAQIKELVIDYERVTLIDPLNITIKNISSTGLLIISPEITLVEGVFLKLEFNLGADPYIVNCKVVREPPEGYDTDSFGCQIIFQEDDS